MEKWRQLEQDPNPFAIVVMAHLQTIATRRDAKERLQGKLVLVRMLYERGYGREDILELFRFIDWVLDLPEELEEDFTRAVEEYEEAMKMPYVTSIERVGMKKGMQQGMEQGLQRGSVRSTREAVIEILKTWFGEIPDSITATLDSMEDALTLKTLLKEAVLAPSLEAFQGLLERERS